MSKCPESDVTIRRAKREDMIQVHKLIKGLAEFEKLADQVKIDHTVLEADGFDANNPIFTCLVAELSSGDIIGYALFYYCYSTWEGKSMFLEDLYVLPECRQRGTGRQLFMAVAKMAYEAKIPRLEFHVLSWNPATDFYKRLGAVDLTSTEKWTLYRMDRNCIQKLFPS